MRAGRRLPAAARAGLRGPRHVGEDRPQPRLQRLQVHAARGEIAVSLRAGRGLDPSCGSRTPAPASRPTSCPGCSSGSIASRAPGADARGHAGSAWRWCRSWSGCTAAGCEVESTFGAGTTFTVTIPTGRDHLPADRIGGTRSLASTALGATPYVEEAFRWLPDPASRRRPRRPGGPRRPLAARRPRQAGPGGERLRDPPGRRQRRHARVRRPPARRALRRHGGLRRHAGPGRRQAAAARPGPLRRDDAHARRLRPAARAAGRPRDRHDPHPAPLGPRGRGGAGRGAGGGRRRLPHQALRRPRAAGPRRRPPRAGPGAPRRRPPRARAPRRGRVHPREHHRRLPRPGPRLADHLPQRRGRADQRPAARRDAGPRLLGALPGDGRAPGSSGNSAGRSPSR